MELTQRPIGNGSVSQLTGGYPDVIDDSDSTKLETTTKWVDEISLFTFADPTSSIPAGAVINSVKIVARGSYESGGFADIGGALKISTVYKSSLVFMTGSYANYTFTWNTNPATGNPWERSDLASFEAGVVLNNGVGGYPPKRGYCAEVWRVVEYTEAIPQTVICGKQSNGTITPVMVDPEGRIITAPVT